MRLETRETLANNGSLDTVVRAERLLGSAVLSVQWVVVMQVMSNTRRRRKDWGPSGGSGWC